MPVIEIKNYVLSFGINIIIPDFNLTVKKGECIGFSGPTGSGKTSIFNHISRVYSQLYKISYVFQQPYLLNNQTVRKNIMLPLENVCDRSIAEKETEKWIELFDLKYKSEYKCKDLSGGEAQRVNLARAFAWNGEIFLLDEPFASQDGMHKEKTKTLINELKELGKTILIVSHDMSDLTDLDCRVVKF